MASAKGQLDDETGRTFDIVVGREQVTGPKKSTNYIETLIHLLKGYVGTGIFAMGNAFMNSGILLGTVFLFLIALLNLYCQHQLVNAAKRVAAREAEEVRPNFAETVKYTVDSGPESIRKYKGVFAKVTNGFLIVTEVGFCCVYFVFVAEHIQQVLKAHGLFLNIYIVLAIVLLPMWASTFLGSLKMLMPLSLTANILMAIGIAMTFYMTAIDLDNLGDRKLVANFKTYPLYLGTALFAYAGITFILPLRNEMRNMDDFDKPLGVLNVGMVIVAICYTLIGFMSYWKYGDKVQGSVFLNFDEHDVFCQVIKVLISVAVMFTFTIHMYVPFEVSYPLFHNKYGPFKHPLLIKGIYRTFPVLVAYGVANVIPKLGIFISLVGSLTIAYLAIMVPPILDMVDREVKVWVIVRNSFIILAGVLTTVTGTYVSIYTAIGELTQDIKEMEDGKK